MGVGGGFTCWGRDGLQLAHETVSRRAGGGLPAFGARLQVLGDRAGGGSHTIPKAIGLEQFEVLVRIGLADASRFDRFLLHALVAWFKVSISTR
jgi:hypothetical protein